MIYGLLCGSRHESTPLGLPAPGAVVVLEEVAGAGAEVVVAAEEAAEVAAVSLTQARCWGRDIVFWL